MQTVSHLRPTLLLAGSRGLAFAVTLCIPVMLARILAPEEFGAYRQVFLVFSTLYAVAQMGMAESLFYFLPRAHAAGSRYVGSALLWLGGAGAACAAGLAAGRTILARLLGNAGLSPLLPLLGLYLMAMLVSAVLEIVMVARGRYAHAAWSYLISDALRAALLVVPAALAGGLEGLLAGAVAFAGLRVVMTLLYLEGDLRDAFRPDAGALRGQLAYAIPFAIAVLVEIVQAQFHLYVVSHRFDAVTFAIYSVGCLQIPLVDLLASPAGNVLMVRMREETREGRAQAAAAVWQDMTRKLAAALFPLAGFLLVAGEDVITVLFTERYGAAVPIFRVWCVGILCSALMTEAVLRVHADVSFLLAVNLFRLGLIAASIGWAMRFLGLRGAVAVTVAAAVLAKGLALLRVRRRMRVRFRELLPWASLGRILGAAGAASLAAWRLTAPWSEPGLVRLLAAAAVYAGSYATFGWVLGVARAGARNGTWRSALRHVAPAAGSGENG